jgi:hypothetical protein
MPNRLDYIAILRGEIEQKHKCEAVHHESVYVHQMLYGETVWKGQIEIFDLTGHARATKCYAWAYRERDKQRTMSLITVLAGHNTDSPEKAVRAAILFDFQHQGPTCDDPPRTDVS